MTHITQILRFEPVKALEKVNKLVWLDGVLQGQETLRSDNGDVY